MTLIYNLMGPPLAHLTLNLRMRELLVQKLLGTTTRLKSDYADCLQVDIKK